MFNSIFIKRILLCWILLRMFRTTGYLRKSHRMKQAVNIRNVINNAKFPFITLHSFSFEALPSFSLIYSLNISSSNIFSYLLSLNALLKHGLTYVNAPWDRQPFQTSDLKDVVVSGLLFFDELSSRKKRTDA